MASRRAGSTEYGVWNQSAARAAGPCAAASRTRRRARATRARAAMTGRSGRSSRLRSSRRPRISDVSVDGSSRSSSSTSKSMLSQPPSASSQIRDDGGRASRRDLDLGVEQGRVALRLHPQHAHARRHLLQPEPPVVVDHCIERRGFDEDGRRGDRPPGLTVDDPAFDDAVMTSRQRLSLRPSFCPSLHGPQPARRQQGDHGRLPHMRAMCTLI